MAEKLSALTSASALGGTELLLVNQGAVSKSTTVDAIVTRAGSTLAPKASPTFTGTPAAPTAAGGTNTTQIATTAFVHGEVATETAARSAADALLAPKAGPAFTGNGSILGTLTIGVASGTGGSGTAGDIVAYRSATTGVVYLGGAAASYLYWDGTNYNFGNNGSSAGVNVDGFLSINAPLRPKTYTVATLPTGGGIVLETTVSDATAPVWNTALVGGGAVKVGARWNLTAWVAF